MREYTVFWRDSAEPGSLYAGGLAVGDDRVWLRGSDGRPAVWRDLPGEEIAAVRPAAGAETIADFPSLRVDLHGGRSVVVATVMGVAALSELLATLVTVFSGG